jgi:hypothetical protein
MKEEETSSMFSTDYEILIPFFYAKVAPKLRRHNFSYKNLGYVLNEKVT